MTKGHNLHPADMCMAALVVSGQPSMASFEKLRSHKRVAVAIK